MRNQETTVRVAQSWDCFGPTQGKKEKTYTLTPNQQNRKYRGLSIWERDRQVAPYAVSKGKFV